MCGGSSLLLEYFADPPMTPQEAQQEKDEVYSEYVLVFSGVKL